MGTPAFAADSLRALLEAGHDVAAVVTRPDAPAGRGRSLRPSEVKRLAAQRGLPLLQPAGVRGEDFWAQVAALEVDLMAVVAFGRILPGALLDIPPMGAVNVHASLLPLYRGAAPIAWAIARGEARTGVTTQRITERLDAGDILMQRATLIGPEETAARLERRLAPLGADLLVETLEGLARGTLAAVPQDESRATHAPLLRKEDGRIDWSRPAEEIARRVRAFDPWPVARTTLPGPAGRPLLVWRASQPPHGERAAAVPGTVLATAPPSAGRAGVLVACGAGALLLEEVQPAGGARMPAAAAVAGRWLAAGDRLGSE